MGSNPTGRIIIRPVTENKISSAVVTGDKGGKMGVVVIYYSRTGNTKKMAQLIHEGIKGRFIDLLKKLNG